MNLFFDLDGTLINSQKRLYALFQFIVPKSNLSFDEYWLLKRNKVNHQEILTEQFNYSSDDYTKFENLWMQEIELEKWLILDSPFEGVTDFLNSLTKKNSLYLVTARQSKDMVYKQIADFGWESFFTKILVTERKFDKFQLISQNCHIQSTDWIIGDTGYDIETGKKLKIKTAAVTNGFLNRECLSQYQPDILIDSVINLTDNMLNFLQ
jgi:phosphoglycolate phosphatase